MSTRRPACPRSGSGRSEAGNLSQACQSADTDPSRHSSASYNARIENFIRSVALFVVAAIAEAGGAYLVWQAVRERDTTSALDRYLRAFESGDLAAPICGRRVEELASRRQELLDYRDDLAAQIRAATLCLPGRDDLAAVASEIRQAVEQGAPGVVKELLAALVHRIEIQPGRRVQPYLRVPHPDPPKGSEPPRALPSAVTPVRIGSHHVEPMGLEPKTPLSK
jgi:hypothetical protein